MKAAATKTIRTIIAYNSDNDYCNDHGGKDNPDDCNDSTSNGDEATNDNDNAFNDDNVSNGTYLITKIITIMGYWLYF